ncbi:MAG: hypothetical protein LBR17_05865 [Bacteroidales bacterium]|jgi:preprotein translocase subunit SecF|nr:hypothetical protein [Bacteroidales bacterium]
MGNFLKRIWRFVTKNPLITGIISSLLASLILFYFQKEPSKTEESKGSATSTQTQTEKTVDKIAIPEVPKTKAQIPDAVNTAIKKKDTTIINEQPLDNKSENIREKYINEMEKRRQQFNEMYN